MKLKSENLCWFVRMLGIYFLSLISGAMNIGTTGSLLKIIGLIPVAIWFVQKMSVYKSRLLTFYFLSVVWIGLSYFWSIDPAKTLQRIITQSSFFLILCSAATYLYNIDEWVYLKKCLVWSSRISAICVLAFSSYHEGRLYLNGILAEDPNYLCAYFLFGVIFCLEILLDECEETKKKGIVLLELCVYFYIIVATGSRGGAFAVITACFVFFIFSQKGKKISTEKIFAPVVIGIFLIIAYQVAARFVPSDVLQRFSIEELAGSNGTGRYIIWEDAWSTYCESGIFRQLAGYGSAAALTIARRYGFRLINVFHNAFIENLLETGFIGLALYMAYIFRFWNCARKKSDIFSFSIMTGLMVLSLSTSIAAFKPYWNVMTFIICTEYKDDTKMKPDHAY